MAKKVKKIAAYVQRWEVWFLVLCFVAAIMLRWFRLDQNLFFGFEQGRDAAIVQNIYLHHDFKLVGPKTDLAGIFHGAYYYYLLVPASWLTHGDPLALSFTLILISSTLAI